MPRFQFSLRTLFIIVTLLALPCGYVGWQAKIVRDRKAMRKELEEHGYIVWGNCDLIRLDWPGENLPSLPWVGSLLGDWPVYDVIGPIPSEWDQEIKATFPEARRTPPIIFDENMLKMFEPL